MFGPTLVLNLNFEMYTYRICPKMMVEILLVEHFGVHTHGIRHLQLHVVNVINNYNKYINKNDIIYNTCLEHKCLLLSKAIRITHSLSQDLEATNSFKIQLIPILLVHASMIDTFKHTPWLIDSNFPRQPRYHSHPFMHDDISFKMALRSWGKFN